MAGDVSIFRHNIFDAEDVNDDGQVSSIDAIVVINALNRRDGSDSKFFSDVNNDSQRSSVDALRVINRLNRESASRQHSGSPHDANGNKRGGSNVLPGLPAEVRSIDGTGNNLLDPTTGAAGTNFMRIAPNDYRDGISEPAGADRPSAREISNALSGVQVEVESSERDLTAFLYVWGQFIDHDLDLTLSQTNGEKLPIEVPSGDPFFDPDATGTATISFNRSSYDPQTGTSTLPREHVNSITAYLDGSMIYGSDNETAAELREFVGGRMLVDSNNMLPRDEEGSIMAGDIRVEENPSLTAIQTLFVREHNRLASLISEQFPEKSDEELYQQARAIVIAEVQAITFNEFLPALLGDRAVSRYRGYDASIDPSIATEFSTAAFRFGHSTLNDDIGFFGNDGRPIREEIELRDAFFQSSIVDEVGLEPILKYDASSVSSEIDLTVVDGLRNFLFGPPGSGGFDLVSLNIQRGRDHGLADYNATREAYGLSRVTSFADITSDVIVQNKLDALYGSVDNVDLWVGLLAEDHLEEGSVGELTRAIIVDQFERVRDGDRLWYENIYSGAELRYLQTTTLASVLERNTGVENLQRNVFFLKATVSGQVTVETPFDDGAGRAGVPIVIIELLDTDGEVIEVTQTDRQGRFRFEDFDETGDYTLRLADGQSVSATNSELSFLVSNGATRLRGLDFSVRLS